MGIFSPLLAMWVDVCAFFFLRSHILTGTTGRFSLHLTAAMSSNVCSVSSFTKPNTVCLPAPQSTAAGISTGRKQAHAHTRSHTHTHHTHTRTHTYRHTHTHTDTTHS